MVSLSLVLSLFLSPRAARRAYAFVPLGIPIVVGAELLSSVFPYVCAALTGIAVGGVTTDYATWAAANPDEEQEFRDYLANNIVAQEVTSDGVAEGLALNLSGMSPALKSSIIDTVANEDRSLSGRPVIDPNGNYRDTLTYFPSSLRGTTVTLRPMYDAVISTGCPYYSIIIRRTGTNQNWKYGSATAWDAENLARLDRGLDVEGQITYTNNTGEQIPYYDISADGTISTFYLNNGDSYHLGYYLNQDNRAKIIHGFDLGAGFESLPVMSGVTSGLSSSFDNLVSGTGTALDVINAGAVTGIYLPNVTVDTNDGAATVDDSYDASLLTYPDVAITEAIVGGDVPIPLPEDVLAALQQIIGLLTPMGAITGIPPIMQDIDTKMGAIVDTWPGVMDILDGLGLLPPIVQDIADGMGVIIDIPQSLEDITDILLPIPQSLQGLLDGVTIDIPQTLTQILNGTLSIPTAIDGVISGVATLPATIASALDIDWVLKNTEELKDRLPDLDAPLILPQASFEDLKNVANDYKERTPLGKIFEAYEGTFEVMSTSPQGAPRYEITFPSPINYTFVIDFAIFDGLFVQLAHAFFYLLAIFWYLKFIKRVKSWIDSWLTLGGGFAEVAEEESYAFRE